MCYSSLPNALKGGEEIALSLESVRILDFSRVFGGRLYGMLLTDMGAEVIRGD